MQIAGEHDSRRELAKIGLDLRKNHLRWPGNGQCSPIYREIADKRAVPVLPAGKSPASPKLLSEGQKDQREKCPQFAYASFEMRDVEVFSKFVGTLVAFPCSSGKLPQNRPWVGERMRLPLK